MSDYTITTDFSDKDALSTGDAEKIILGADFDVEFDALQVAVNSKYDADDLASTAEVQAETSNAKLVTPLRLAEWADDNAGLVGDFQALTDPGADRLVMWDDSAGAAVFMTAGTGLSISGTTLSTDDANIDHDALTNFVANEHIDWTANSGSTIDDNNLSSNVALRDAVNVFTGAISIDLAEATSMLTLNATTSNNGLRFRSTGTGNISITPIVSGTPQLGRELFFNSGTDEWDAEGTWNFISGGLAIGGGQTISDSDNVALLGTANTFTALQEIASTTPSLRFHETDASANEGEWKFAVASGDLFVQSRGDGDTSGETLLQAGRTGTAITTIAFPNGAVSISDSLAIGGGQTISDSDNVALLSNSNTFTGNLLVSRSDPRIILIETDASTNEGRWDFNVVSGQFRIETRNDASGAPEALITADRTASAIDTVNFPNGELQYGGVEVGFREMLVTEQNGEYTTDADDSHGLIYKDAGGTGEVITIDGSDYSTGAVISFVNNGGGDLTIAIQDDTLHQAGTGSTGSRTLADHGMATAVKVDASNWFISGTGLS